MLIDANLLNLKKKADQGDPIAQVEIADAFYLGRGAPVDYEQAKKYLIMLSQNDPDDLPQYGYGTLLYLIGERCRNIGQLEEANVWYKKSRDYFREIYIDAFANELISDFCLESLIKITSQ